MNDDPTDEQIEELSRELERRLDPPESFWFKCGEWFSAVTWVLGVVWLWNSFDLLPGIEDKPFALGLSLIAATVFILCFIGASRRARKHISQEIDEFLMEQMEPSDYENLLREIELQKKLKNLE